MRSYRPRSRLLIVGVLIQSLLMLSAGMASAATISFASAGPIIIPSGAPGATAGTADPYPSTINVVSDPASPFRTNAVVWDVKVFLDNLTHTWPDDLDIMLVGPTGKKVTLMSDAGGGTALSSKDLYFSNSFGTSVPDESVINGTNYKPSNYGTAANDNYPAPVPVAGNAGLNFNVFDGVNPFGNWGLFIVDDGALDSGRLDGWRLDFSFLTPEQLQPVPEPGTMLLIGTGVAAMMARRRLAARRG